VEAQSFNFTPIDVPCSACPGGIARRTAVGGINSAGEIVGVYTDAVGKSNGFLLRDEEFITIEVPGSLVVLSVPSPTVARGISPSGEVVGQFTAPYNPPASTSAGFDSPAYCPAAGSAACIKGFLYSHGHFSAVLFPGHPGTIPQRITRDGSIYGCLHDFDLMNSMFSAAWNRFGDTSLTAGGGALTDPNQSFPNSMHGGATPDGDTVVGFYVDMMTNHNARICAAERRPSALRRSQQHSNHHLGHQSSARIGGNLQRRRRKTARVSAAPRRIGADNN